MTMDVMDKHMEYIEENDGYGGFKVAIQPDGTVLTADLRKHAGDQMDYKAQQRAEDRASYERIRDEATALQEQEGGSHYKDMKIQPIEYCMANKLNACQSHMIKYISRYPNKNGAEDLRKVIHLAKLALHLEYGETYEN